MSRTISRGWWLVTVAVAAVVAGAAIAQAVRQQSPDPLWQVGWLPAVMLATRPRRPGPGRACADRARRRSRSSAGTPEA
jgi:hypothetical protein